jgi:hypothetical protein
MPEDYIDCPEMTGKTIELLRIHRDVGEGTSVQIELTDGTSFTCYVSVRPNVEASLYKGGVGSAGNHPGLRIVGKIYPSASRSVMSKNA